MSFELAFRSRVAFIMETLTATALQDICQFMEETYAALRVEILQEQNRSSTTKLHAMENSEGKEKPANSMESVQEDARSSGFRNFPVVEQILNEQEANGLWLEGDPTVEDEGPPSLVPEEEQPLQPFGQMTDKGVETCSAPLVIKQEETDDDVKESQGYSVWMPETHKTNQNITGESDEEERSQASRGSKELGLDDFKKEQSLLLVSIEHAAAPTKKKKYNIRYTCKICGKTGTKKGRMTSHLITHEGPSSCDICDEKFKHQNGLNKHKLLKHSVKPYSCFVCGKMFLYSKIRDYHERIHVGEDYWCADCGKTFKERQDRDTHECIVCKGDRPYSCSECNKDFERQYHLKKHQLEKHPLMVEQTVEPEPESKHFEDQQRQFESAESSEAPIRSEPLASIMEVLANAAVAEICQLVDDGYAVLRLEISRTQGENQALKNKLHLVEVRSRERSVKRSIVPPLSICFGAQGTDQVEKKKQSPSVRRNGGSVVLGDRSTRTVSEEKIDTTEHPEVVVVKEEKLEEELRDCGSKHNQQPRRLISVSQSLVAVNDQILNAETSPVEVAEEKRNCDNQRLQQTANGHSTASQHTHSSDCVTYQRESHTAAGLSRIEDGRDMLDPSCSYLVETDSTKSLDAQPPLTQSGVTTLCDSMASSASLGWKQEAGGVDTLKMEAGMPSWTKGRDIGMGLAAQCGVDIPGKNREGVQLGNGTNVCPQSNVNLRESESSEGRKSSEPDVKGFDTSLDYFFSPSEMAGIQTHHQGDGAGGEELTSCPYPGDDGFVSPSNSTQGGLLFSNRLVNCQECGRLFSNSLDLALHQRIHMGEKLFSCAQCDKQFLHLHQLKTHQRIHTREKPFSCSQCGKRFSQSSHIKRHMSVHTGEKRFGCSVCGKKFSQSCSLKVHQSVHTGERPFSCTQCGKSFSVLGNLMRHQSVHSRKQD